MRCLVGALNGSGKRDCSLGNYPHAMSLWRHAILLYAPRMPNTSRFGIPLLLPSRRLPDRTPGSLRLLLSPLPRHRLRHSSGRHCRPHHHLQQLLLHDAPAAVVPTSSLPLPLLQSFHYPLIGVGVTRRRPMSVCRRRLLLRLDIVLRLCCRVYQLVGSRIYQGKGAHQQS